MPHLRVTLPRPARRAAPSCRGGASSMLRVTAAGRRGVAFAEAIAGRIASSIAGDVADPQPGFITPLHPSTDLGLRTAG